MVTGVELFAPATTAIPKGIPQEESRFGYYMLQEQTPATANWPISTLNVPNGAFGENAIQRRFSFKLRFEFLMVAGANSLTHYDGLT